MPYNTYTLEELRVRLNLQGEPHAILQKLRTMQRKHHFPPPIPSTKAWSKALVDEWIVTSGTNRPTIKPIRSGAFEELTTSFMVKYSN